MKNPKLEALVFDNNGTMLDDLHLAYGSVEMIFAVLGLRSPTKDQYRNEIGANYMDFYWNHGVPRDITGKQLNVIRELYYRTRRGTVHFRPDLLQTLEHCASRGLSLAVCSAEKSSILQEFLFRDGLVGRFDLIRAEAWPEKAPALVETIETLDVAPERAAYVDDTVDGINAAREAGLRSIAFAHPTGYSSAQRLWAEKPDHVVSDFAGLRRLVTELTS